MSRIGKAPIELPKGVELKVDGRNVFVKGPKGQLTLDVHDSMDIKLEGTTVTVVPKVKVKENAKFHGLTRTLVNNMVIGCSVGFSKSLTLVGVGYRAQSKGKAVNFTLGHSHPILFDPPQGIEIQVPQPTSVIVTGASKELVGQVAAEIRGFRPPEPYHGKGVRYSDERIATKVGKAAGKK